MKNPENFNSDWSEPLDVLAINSAVIADTIAYINQHGLPQDRTKIQTEAPTNDSKAQIVSAHDDFDPFE